MSNKDLVLEIPYGTRDFLPREAAVTRAFLPSNFIVSSPYPSIHQLSFMLHKYILHVHIGEP